MFDNCLELLVLAGRSLPHAMMMMIPEPWTNHESMSENKKTILRVPQLPLMEAVDGPASRSPSPTDARSARFWTATDCARQGIM